MLVKFSPPLKFTGLSWTGPLWRRRHQNEFLGQIKFRGGLYLTSTVKSTFFEAKLRRMTSRPHNILLGNLILDGKKCCFYRCAMSTLNLGVLSPYMLFILNWNFFLFHWCAFMRNHAEFDRHVVCLKNKILSCFRNDSELSSKKFCIKFIGVSIV